MSMVKNSVTFLHRPFMHTIMVRTNSGAGYVFLFWYLWCSPELLPVVTISEVWSINNILYLLPDRAQTIVYWCHFLWTVHFSDNFHGKWKCFCCSSVFIFVYSPLHPGLAWTHIIHQYSGSFAFCIGVKFFSTLVSCKCVWSRPIYWSFHPRKVQ